MRKWRCRGRAAALVWALWLAAGAAGAQVLDETYGDRLLRLAEILGAIHHLRDVCGADEGQLWRDQMLAMLEAEDPPGQFRARLIGAFNNGYRGYRRTYLSCTASAKTAETRFLAEGSQIASALTVTLATPADAEASTGPKPAQ